MTSKLIATSLAFCAAVLLTTAANAQIYQLDVTGDGGTTNVALGTGPNVRTQLDSGTLTGSFLFNSIDNSFSNASFTYEWSYDAISGTESFSGLDSNTAIFRDFDTNSTDFIVTSLNSQLFFDFFDGASPRITSGITELNDIKFRFNLYGNSPQLTSGDTTATFSVTAVPEPETYAMFLAGLGLLGFARRSKKA